MDTIAIVGAGQAAATAVEALRKEGYAGQLVVVGDEPYPPYQRPPLSKKFLEGAMPLERLLVKPASFYGTARADLKIGVRAEALDLRDRQLRLSDGSTLRYDQLLLATGSSARKLAVPGSTLAGVHYLRGIADVHEIRAQLDAAPKRVVVVGAGYIGLEVAATCRQMGHQVDVLEMADRPMNRVVSPGVSSFFLAEHARQGVRIHLQTQVSALEPRADAVSCVGCVHTIDGRAFPADLVVVGIGVVPSTVLAEDAGLAIENGVVVDEHCRTSDPSVYAAGDCTNYHIMRYRRRVRLESVDNAFQQAKTSAANILGRRVVHDALPWFWSDQYDLKLLIAGLNLDHDQALIRGDPATRAFSCCYLRGSELLAIDCVNSPKDYMAAKRLIPERAHFNLSKLADAGVTLTQALE